MSTSNTTIYKRGKYIKSRVYFTGSTAIREGQGLCYDRDRGTASDADDSRTAYVELPSTTNNLHFAGVAVTSYPARSGGQWISIYEPGSHCLVSIGTNTTIDSTILTCSCGTGDAGRFTEGGFLGRGSAIALQTNSSAVLGSSLDGTATISNAGVISKTGLFANATVGDTVVIVAGATTASSANTVTTGEYTITSKASDDAATVQDSDGNVPSTDAASIACYIVSGSTDPKCLVYLMDGPESGLQHWTTPKANAQAVPAASVGGTTFIFGGHTIGTGDSTFTLADGVRQGLRKRFKLRGALTTNDYLVTVTSGVQLDGSTALASLEFDGANDESILEWIGQKWRLIANAGTLPA